MKTVVRASTACLYHIRLPEGRTRPPSFRINHIRDREKCRCAPHACVPVPVGMVPRRCMHVQYRDVMRVRRVRSCPKRMPRVAARARAKLVEESLADALCAVREQKSGAYYERARRVGAAASCVYVAQKGEKWYGKSALHGREREARRVARMAQHDAQCLSLPLPACLFLLFFLRLTQIM